SMKYNLILCLLSFLVQLVDKITLYPIRYIRRYLLQLLKKEEIGYDGVTYDYWKYSINKKNNTVIDSFLICKKCYDKNKYLYKIDKYRKHPNSVKYSYICRQCKEIFYE
ncbi:MAG TPA: hypothetical protein PKL44_00180, partial [Candidatus Dojkabacteria bacterium]|nr:hypothetical protein [Candidatus Dojkabacteria bacterium]